MFYYFALWCVTALAFMVTAYLLPGFRVSSFTSAMVAAAVLGFVNILIRPLLVFLTLPISILTMGLFLLVVNALCLWLASALTPGFEIRGFGWALLGSIVLTLASALLQHLAAAL